MHVNQFLRCIVGMSGNKYKALEHPYPTLIDKIEKWGYDEKQLLHIVRLNDFVKQYLSGRPIKACFTPKKSTLKFIRRIREHKYTLEQARRIAYKYDTNTKKKVDGFISNNSDKYLKSNSEWLDKIVTQILKQSLTKELMEGVKSETK